MENLSINDTRLTNGANTKLIKKLYGVPSERGGTTWLEECPDYIKSPPHDVDYALVVRYKEARSGIVRKALNLTSIHIQSPYLKQVIRHVFKNYPGETVDEDEPSFEAPFHPFFHQWATLSAELERSKHEVDGKPDQIEALMNVLLGELEQDIKDSRSLARSGNINFRLLWTLYPPGCPVIGQFKDKEHCFLVNESKYLVGEIEPTFLLDLLVLDHDGERYGWRKMPKTVAPFSGSVRITDLPAVPLHFLENPLEIMERLSSRGATAVELLRKSPAYEAYDGPVRLHYSLDLEEQEVFVEGRAIVDAKGHSRQASRYCPKVFTIPHKLECMLTRDQHTKMAVMVKDSEKTTRELPVSENLNRHLVLNIGRTKLEPELPTDVIDNSPLGRHRWTQMLFGVRTEAFCRSAVRGYCLTSKSWAQFEVENITDIKWNKNAFDALVMKPARKRLLEALVKQQQQHKADADVDDVVQGKGQGLIMLLTGPPGTGKTLTAESIADRLQLPLYSVSASELGDTAKGIEAQFGEVLRLAASWNALLLLDEADAFLERRVDSPDARERNKRVAAFLRILEYYKGILILTTNRIVNFDIAFYSRIHLTLPFHSLDRKSREDIWKNFLRGAKVSDSDLAQFASEELNGRQIKNTMKMARLLAMETGTELNSGHISDVLDVLKEDVESNEAQ